MPSKNLCALLAFIAQASAIRVKQDATDHDVSLSVIDVIQAYYPDEQVDFSFKFPSESDIVDLFKDAESLGFSFSTHPTTPNQGTPGSELAQLTETEL